MPRRSRTEQKKPVATLDDLLSKWQGKWLKKELLLWKFLPGEFECLRATPYPLDHTTAALIEYLGAEYTLPWPVAQLEFGRWVYMSFWGPVCPEAERQICTPEEAEELCVLALAGALPGDWGERFREQCDRLERAIEAAVEGTALARNCVRMPYLPLGATLLSFLPLIEGEWVDAEALALCEACGALTRDGHVRLAANDPHVLAWHRFFPRRAWWAYPDPCRRKVFLDGADQARLALSTCPARRQEFSGRLHFHFEDYAAWEGRSVPGDLNAGVFPGLWVERWNARAHDRAAQRSGLARRPVCLLTHPCRYACGKDYARFENRAEAEAALQVRTRALGVRVTAALAEAGKTPGCWPLSTHQQKILAALDGKALEGVDLALALETPAELEASEGSKQRTLYRELSLLNAMGLVANDRSLGGYYRPDRPPAGHSAR